MSAPFHNILTRNRSRAEGVRATTFLSNLNGHFSGIRRVACLAGPLTFHHIHRVKSRFPRRLGTPGRITMSTTHVMQLITFQIP